jgi:hypothetical protein
MQVQRIVLLTLHELFVTASVSSICTWTVHARMTFINLQFDYLENDKRSEIHQIIVETAFL